MPYHLHHDVGREEIKRHRKSFLNSSERKRRDRKLKGARTQVCSRSGQNPVDRLVDRCSRRAQAWPDRPWQRNGQPTWSTDWHELLSVGAGRPGWLTEDRGRSTDRRGSVFPFRIWIPFLIWGQIQLGFPKSLGLSGYKYRLEPSRIVSH